MQTRGYDAIVVGSGISGGWAAMELTRRGLNTLCLEAGRPITPETDYVEHVQPWELRFRGRGDHRRIERDQPVRILRIRSQSIRRYAIDGEYLHSTSTFRMARTSKPSWPTCA